MTDDDRVEISSGNVFADLGFADPALELLRAKLAREIRDTIARRGLTQDAAARRMGLRQPDVSAIINGRTGRFSVDRLVRSLSRLDVQVDLVVAETA